MKMDMDIDILWILALAPANMFASWPQDLIHPWA